MEPKYTEGSNGGPHSDRHSNAQIPAIGGEFGPTWILGSLGYQGHYRIIMDIKDTYRTIKDTTTPPMMI